jgi:hypothetical protein
VCYIHTPTPVLVRQLCRRWGQGGVVVNNSTMA